MEFIRRYRTSLIMLIVYMLSSLIYAWTNQPIGTVRVLHHPLDDIIPLIPSFIVIYHTWYPFMIGGAISLFFRDEIRFQRLMIHLLISQVLAIGTFIFFQTEVLRPEITGTDIFSRILAWTYSIDGTYNGIPSIHVLSTLVVAGHFSRAFWHKPLWVGLYWLYGGLIIASTVLVKQHMFWDLPGAVLAAIVSYGLARICYRYRWKGRLREPV